jgi:photosystem II stability/assembly factor-like uncharacterized protein
VIRTHCPVPPIFRSARWIRLVYSLTLLLVLWASPARSHDPSAWGGLFRSRDHGATWVSLNNGQFVSGAIALAVSPADANHLLLGAESGLLRSRNGGRDWFVEAPAVMVGPVFALAFAADGQRALVSTGLGIFGGETENVWQQAAALKGAAPARAIVRGGEAGRVYLAGRTGVFRSDDWGTSWSSAANGLPHEPATALLVVHGSPETLYAIVQGKVWVSVNGSQTWASRGAGMFATNVDALAADPRHPARLWAAGGDRLFTSNDGGASWHGFGQPLPEPNTDVRGITASEEAVIVTTDRGLYRTVDSGERWTLIIENLPAHLGAGPLVPDPVDPATIYAGFALVPYPEIWRRAAEREGALVRVSVTSLAASVVFLVLIALGAFAALRWLGHYYRPPMKSGPTKRTAVDPHMGKTLP